MATRKSKTPTAEGTRLTHVNGATVTVTAEKAERLLAGGLFTTATARRSAAAAKTESD